MFDAKFTIFNTHRPVENVELAFGLGVPLLSHQRTLQL